MVMCGGVFDMNKIITIGREFGSGGREFGKRLAEYLGIAYYDKEIITEISKKTQLAEEYIQAIEDKPISTFPITIGNSFYAIFNPISENVEVSVYAEQNNILVDMAKRSSCVIIGRCADYILEEFNPFRIFIYSDMKTKISRCIERVPEGENLSEKQLKNQIISIDKNRAKYYQFITGNKWGDRLNYDLCVNTSSLSIKYAAEYIGKMIESKM